MKVSPERGLQKLEKKKNRYVFSIIKVWVRIDRSYTSFFSVSFPVEFPHSKMVDTQSHWSPSCFQSNAGLASLSGHRNLNCYSKLGWKNYVGIPVVEVLGDVVARVVTASLHPCHALTANKRIAQFF